MRDEPSRETPARPPREAVDASEAKPGWSLEAGARLRQYEIIREIGRGGMGVVYLARDTRLGRRVAIKLLTARNLHLTKDLLREARATATCHHDNIVVIYEADEHDGMPYLVLEHLEGRSLRETMRAQRIAPARAVELMVPVVRALVCAHERGIVHRDLKPENVFVTTGGGIKVLDFGIAALHADGDAARRPEGTERTERTEGAESGPRKAATRERMAGTLAYMAVEQLEGGGADERSDLWAVGIMLYEMLAGHHPVHPLSQAALLRHGYFLDEPLPPIGDIVAELPHRLSRLVDRCLEKRKDRRIATAREVLAELEPLMPGRTRRVDSLETGPYPGLTAFQEGDADRFYGRDGDVFQVATRLRDHPMVAVVGASGLGKSSFVRAGLVPALRASLASEPSADGWDVLIVRPGRQPLRSLATVLRPLAGDPRAAAGASDEPDDLLTQLRGSPGHAGALLRAHAARRGRRVLLFVDQMEELYTLVPDEAERCAFTGCLSGVADDPSAPLRVLVCMRSDFLDRVGEDRRFFDDLVGGLHFLQPLAPAALREALEAPVAQLGYSFESASLLTEMVDSLVATPGSLPLLQFAGAKLWEARDDRRKVLTEASYRRIGGISGVLAQHADQVVAALPSESRNSVRRLFQRLVTADGTRAIVDLAELSSAAMGAADVRGLVDHLSQARLVVVQSREDDGGATVELVHESLISGWPTLRRWLDEGREDAAFREQLRAAAKQWEARERDPGLLWRGEAMAEARLWRARHSDPLPEREQAFIDALIQLGTRAQNLRRGAAAGAIGLLSIVIAVGSIAFVQVRRAEHAALREADVAGREATRARAAEDKITAQLQVIRREQAAKAAAETEVQRGKQDLRAANVDLQRALVKTEAESKRAQDAAERAVTLADSLRTTNARLEQLLAEERARTERLQNERRKITNELR
jgi:eukaryotic-like serine/threonine-protein kinase